MNSFNEAIFRAKVDAALVKVRTILDNEKKPLYAENVPHEYEDKYLLAEALVNSALNALVQAFEAIGFTENEWKKVQQWNRTRSVTLRFKAEEKCKLNRKAEREVKSDTTHVTQSTLFGTSKSYTVTKITEWFWDFSATSELQLFMGNDSDHPIVLKRRQAGIELKTTSDVTPKPVSVVLPNIDVNISWFLTQLDEERRNASKFGIDRAAKSTHTPRRNDAVSSVFSNLATLHSFASQVHSYLMRRLWPVDPDHNMDLSAIKDGLIFVPVLPLFEGQGKDDKKKKKKSSKSKESKSESSRELTIGSGALPTDYAAAFLVEQRRDMTNVFANNEKLFTSSNPHLPNPEDANLLCILLHMQSIAQSATDGLDYIELMLRNQLIAAIGKIVQPSDLAAYMRFHYRKLFADEFQPNQFCYAVRRPDHYPEGIVSIEADVDGSLPDPVSTIVNHVPLVRRPMKFSLDASTNVDFFGERYLHGFVSHQFSGQGMPSLNLVARARQFSSFILMVGRIATADLFEPKYAIIIKDKDELKLPLLLETLPTPKEFRDAIESLSPEQQRFAKAYRSMQLESTLFGVAIIQIKPQLEKLLNLPNDALTKEIALTQDLLELFIEYQVPSDLISYDGDRNVPKSGKISVVRGYVEAMKRLIEANKNKSLEEAQEKQAYRVSENDELASALSVSLDDYDEMPTKNIKRKKMKEVEYKKESKKEERHDKEKSKDKSDKAPVAKKRAMKSAASPSTGGGAGRGGSATGGRHAHSATSSSSASGGKQAAAPVTPSQPQGQQTQTVVSPRAGEDKVVEPIEEYDDEEEELVDYTKIPAELEEKYTELDVDGALRPTIINPGNEWTKSFRTSLMSDEQKTVLLPEEQGRERNKAFDLLDALTKSGALAVEEAALHVVIAATHCFDKTLMDTIIQDNINPIEKIERSALIIASTIHGTPAMDIIRDDQRERVAIYSPMLIEDAPAAADTVASSSSVPDIAVRKGSWVF